MKTLLAVLFFLTLGVAAAQETDEDALFGGDSVVQEGEESADETSTTGDGLFGEGGELFTDVEEAADTDPSAALLEGGTTLGGDFAFSVEGMLELDPEGEASFASGTADLKTRLFIDARPQRDFRVFADGDLEYSTVRGGTFALDELFADAELGSIFVRAGKQTVNWGVGYFYSPANLINLERIDPENPGEDLSGPPALRAQLPLEGGNLTGYVLTDDFAEDLNLSAAARFETLLSGFEVTTGGVSEDSGAWAVMGTATGGIADVTVFGEAVLEGNIDKVFVYEDEASPSGFSTTQSESLFFSGTLGGRYTYQTDDERSSVTATAQYFFNGKGYEDPELFTDSPEAVTGLVGSGALSPDDLQERGQHYLGVNVTAPEVDESDFTPSALWLANLGDGSGLVNAQLNYALNDFLTPRLEYRFRYGETGSEYNPGSERHSLMVGLDISGAF